MLEKPLTESVSPACAGQRRRLQPVLSRREGHRYVDHVNVFKGLIWPTSHELVRDGEEFRNKTAAREHGRFSGT